MMLSRARHRSLHWLSARAGATVRAARWGVLVLLAATWSDGTPHGQTSALPTRGVEEIGRTYIGEPMSVFVGHLAMLFVTGKHATTGNGTMQDTVDWVNDPLHSVVADGTGGLAVYAHPDTSDRVLLLTGLTGMELYSQGVPSSNRDRMWDTVLTTLYSQGKPLIWAFAADDTHYTVNPGINYNLAWNTSLVPTVDLPSLKTALRNGAFYATSGPAINAVSVTGTTITLDLGQSSEVDWLRGGQYNATGVTFTQSTTLGQGKAVKRDLNVTSSSLDISTLGVPMSGLQFVRAIIKTADGKDALTQPFAISAAGAIANPYPTSGTWVRGMTHNHDDAGIGLTGLTTYRSNYQAVGQLGAFETGYSYWETPYQKLDSDGMPDIASISPRKSDYGAGLDLTVTGVNFIDGATIQLGPYPLTNVVRQSSTTLRGTIPVSTPPGVYDVVVTNPDNYRGTLGGAFVVQEATAVNAGWASYRSPSLPWDQTTSIASIGNDVWVGTMTGAARYQNGSWTTFVPGSGFSRGIYGIIADPAGGMWFSSVGLWFRNAAGAFPWQNQLVNNPAGMSERWGRMAFDSTGQLWVTSRWAEGLAIRSTSGVWTRWTKAANGLPNDDNQVIARDSLGNMWVGFSGGSGVWKWNGTTWQQVTIPAALPQATFASAITPGKNGDMWVAVQPMNLAYTPAKSGVVRFRSDGTTDVYKLPQLPHARISDILVAANGDVWFASRVGVTRFDTSGQWKTFTAANSGLVSDIVMAMTEDSSGRIWFATASGVSSFLPFDFSMSNGGGITENAGSFGSTIINTSLLASPAQSVAFTVSGLPANTSASFSPSSCTPGCTTSLSISSTSSAIDGTYHLTVSGTAGTIIRTTSLDLVVVAHHAPVITNPGQQQSTEGDVISLPIIASDVDGDTLTYSATGLPTGLSIDAATGVIAGTVAPASAATYTPTVTVSDGGLNASTSFNWIVSPAAPASPTGLTATAASSTSIALSWTDSASNEDGFTIERSTDGTTFSPAGGTAANVTSFSDTGLSPATAYTYRVRAYNPGGTSSYSNTASATTLPTAPAAPSGLSAAATSSTAIALTWTDTATNETAFYVERSADGVAFVQIAATVANATSYADTGLSAATAYTYRVRAHNTGGDSAYSNTAAATTLPTAPAAPTGLSASATSSSSITLAWTDASSNEDSFAIERSTDGVAFTQLATASANATSYTDNGLSAATAYTYRVRAHNTGGDSAYSNTAAATTLPTAPTAPSGLSASATSSSSIVLTWTDTSSNEDDFAIERSTDGVTFTPLASVAADVSAYTDNGLSGGSAYTYRVRAHNAGGNSAYSNTAAATTLPGAPSAPSGLAASAASSSSIALTWTDTSANEDSFAIERSTDGVAFSQIATTAANATAYTDTGLSTSTAYTYRVRAHNAGGDSAYSNTAAATTLPSAPSAPTGLSASATSSSSIGLTWSDTSNNEDSFAVERSSDGVTFSQIATTTANATGYTDNGLSAATAYTYRVRAHNAGGDSSYTNTAAATTLPVAPSAPSGLNASATSTSSISLTWTDTSTNEDSFTIERSADGVTFSQIATAPANATGYTDSGLSAATAYTYRVRAHNAGGDSSYSNTAAATTLPTAPSAPAGLSASATSSSSIALTWSDTSTNEDSFAIERSTDGLTFNHIATAAANATSYTDNGLSAATAYTYRVRAHNAGGDSSYSNAAAATTLPAAPSAPAGLSASATSSSSIALTWSDTSTNEDSFTIERSTDGVTFSQIATTAANATTYTDTGLSAGTAYTYRARAHNAGGDSAYSNAAAATTLPSAPSAPAGLSASATSSSSIALTWSDTSNNEDSFAVERSSDGVTFSQIATTSANATSYTDNGLSAATAYTYRVRAHNAGGDSSYSNAAAATTLPAAPSAPTGLSASATSTSSIALTWTDTSTNEDGFTIERSTDGITFAPIATAPANATGHTDNGLSAATAYTYRVRAHNAGGDSSYSNTAAATTLPTAPSAPAGLSASTTSSSSIALTWSDTSTNEDSFAIERSSDGVTFGQIATTAANVTSYADSGLASATAYTYRVRAHNAGGYSTYSNAAAATTLPTAPSAPAGLSASATSSSSIALTWTDTSTNEDSFAIERSVDGVTFSQIAATAANATGYTDTGLSPATAYTYRVRAHNAGGDSAYSNTAAATTLPTAPAAPTGLTATAASNSSIALAWTDTSSNEAGFRVEQSPDGISFTQIASTAPNTTSLTVTGLAASTKYYYRVRSFNAGGTSAYSNTSSATTLPNPPGAPTGLAATATTSSAISLAWTDNATNETAYLVERSTNGVSFTQIASLAANVTSYTNTGLTASTTYSYRVRASNAGGTSAYSNTASATTLPTVPAAPSSLGATVASSTAITLSWKDNSNNESGFRIEQSLNGTTFTEIGTVAANVTTFSSTSLTAATKYYYRVRAYNVAGTSNYSNTVNATTLPNPPTAPTSLTGTATTTSVTLAWTDTSTNDTGFKIERSPDGITFTQVATVGANSTSYKNNGLTTGTNYWYRVRATNTGGDSAYSNVLAIKTKVK